MNAHSQFYLYHLYIHIRIEGLYGAGKGKTLHLT